MNIRPWEAKTQEQFLPLAVQWYRWKAGITEKWEPYYWYPGKGRWVEHLNCNRDEVIRWLYKLGRDYNVLDMDYVEFSNVVLDRHKEYVGGRWNYFKRCLEKFLVERNYNARNRYCERCRMD